MKKGMVYIKNLMEVLILPIALLAVFAVATNGAFINSRILMTALRQSVMGTIVCLGLTLNLNMGMMNFAGGASMICGAVIGGNLAMATGSGVPGLIFFCLIIGVGLMTIQGGLYNAFRVPCVVLSLGLTMVYEAVPRIFYPEGCTLPIDMTKLALSPYCFIIMIVMCVAFYIITEYTVLGHNMKAIGENPAIAMGAGLNIDKVKLMSFILTGVFFSIGALMYVSKGSVDNVAAMGSMPVQMESFTGMFLGKFLGKNVNKAISVPVGVFSMKLLASGLTIVGLNSNMQTIIQGTILLVLLSYAANTGLIDKIKADREFAKMARARA